MNSIPPQTSTSLITSSRLGSLTETQLNELLSKNVGMSLEDIILGEDTDSDDEDDLDVDETLDDEPDEDELDLELHVSYAQPSEDIPDLPIAQTNIETNYLQPESELFKIRPYLDEDILYGRAKEIDITDLI